MKQSAKIYFVKLLIFFVFEVQSKTVFAQQEDKEDSLQFIAIDKSKIALFFDDIYFTGGLSTGGLRYSNHFRNLSYGSGFTFCAEKYLPVGKQVFVHTGINFSQRSFVFRPTEGDIDIKSLHFELPLLASFELPVLRKYDFRLILGCMNAFRLYSDVRGDYSAMLLNNPDVFQYKTQDFRRFDFGWVFGCGIEHRNIMLRVRSFSGLSKFDRKEQGMYHSLHLDLGFFLFRK